MRAVVGTGVTLPQIRASAVMWILQLAPLNRPSKNRLLAVVPVAASGPVAVIVFTAAREQIRHAEVGCGNYADGIGARLGEPVRYPGMGN